MITAAITLLAISSGGIIVAVVMERRTHEPKWKLLMKICPWLCGVGGILFGIAIAGGV